MAAGPKENSSCTAIVYHPGSMKSILYIDARRPDCDYSPRRMGVAARPAYQL